MTRRFVQVDVFGESPYLGNPVAVVLDANGMDDATMASIARWTNLSETTFVLSPTTRAADYRVRIWTPFGELPFAGHPTLGTCCAWRSGGGIPRQPGVTIQECDAGLVGAEPPGTSTDVEVRAFFPKDGLPAEDPVTGSLNASIGQWLIGSGRLRSALRRRPGFRPRPRRPSARQLGQRRAGMDRRQHPHPDRRHDRCLVPTDGRIRWHPPS